MPRRIIIKAGIGTPDGKTTNTTHQVGMISMYYLGAIMGSFAGGWLADRIGRINGHSYASMFALVGGALQAATRGSNFILVARVVTGLGTGGEQEGHVTSWKRAKWFQR